MKTKNQAGNLDSLRVYLLIFFCIPLTINIYAQGNLLISPKRVVFEAGKKVQVIDLINIGADTAVYFLSFVQNRVKVTGDYELITKPDSGQRFASPYLRVFPRKVILAPREAQNVKVQLIQTAGLLDGEYRSHLYFRSEKNNFPLGEVDNKADTKTVSVKIIATYGITIPCLIRKGVSTTNVSISDLEFENESDSLYFLKMTFHRTGNMSTYGTLSVNYINNENKTFEVGKTNGVAVLTPGTLKKCKIAIRKPEGITFKGGKFMVEYSTPKDVEKPSVLAKAEMALKPQTRSAEKNSNGATIKKLPWEPVPIYREQF